MTKKEKEDKGKERTWQRENRGLKGWELQTVAVKFPLYDNFA